MSVPGVWDRTVWDGARWQPPVYAPGAGWGNDWVVWYQYDGRVVWDMTSAVVEARWTTDAHTTGDGTFRGDLQPGSLTMRLNDPGHQAEQLSKAGTIWLHYGPASYTWGFYLETVTRQLVAPDDPTAADVVVVGSPWPLRLTTDCLHNFARPAERADTRLNAIAAQLNANAELMLPAYGTNVAADSHTVPPVTPVAWDANTYPSALSLVRAAAADGVAWVSASVDGSGLGRFTLNYARWESAPMRPLVASDLVAGIPFDSTTADVLTQVEWDATNAAGVTTNVLQAAIASVWAFGYQKATMRVWADVAGADNAPMMSTGQAVLNRRGDPNVTKLSTVTAISGARSTPAGAAGPTWNPAAHVWHPSEVLQWVTPPEWARDYDAYYRVISTAHQLRAAEWTSAHTVELYVYATALPA